MNLHTYRAPNGRIAIADISTVDPDEARDLSLFLLAHAETIAPTEELAPRGAVAGSYYKLLLDLEAGEPVQVASLIADLLLYADTLPESGANVVLDIARGHYNEAAGDEVPRLALDTHGDL